MAETFNALELEKDNYDNFSYMKTFLNTCFQVVFTLFLSGPVKIFLDVKRGETSLQEMQDDLQDDRSWFHKKMGVDERAPIFPDREPQGPRRRNRQRSDSHEDDDDGSRHH